MSEKEQGVYGRLPQAFRDNPGAYDIWQAYVLLSACAIARRGGGWSFGFPASQAFPASEIAGISVTTSRASDKASKTWMSRELLRLDVTVPGIFGPDGPLPPEFRETVIQERDEGNRVLQDFLDLFQNRLMRLWMEDAAGMCAELGGEREKGEDLAAVCARALAWADMDVEQFGGGWVEMPEQYPTRLGVSNSMIGAGAILGKIIFEQLFEKTGKIPCLIAS